MNNYRVDIFRKNGIHYQIEFPEFYLAKLFAQAATNENDVSGIYILERIIDSDTFDVTRKIK